MKALTRTVSPILRIPATKETMWCTLIVTVKVACFSLKSTQTLVPVSFTIFEMEEAEVTTVKSKSITIHKDALLPLKLCLQRLCASRNTAEHMRCHHQYPLEDIVFCHRLVGAARKHFGNNYLNCAVEPWNVVLRLCADGFNPYVFCSRSCSIWSMAVTTYNLHPEMCMTTPFMFLTCVISDANNPKNRTYVCL